MAILDSITNTFKILYHVLLSLVQKGFGNLATNWQNFLLPGFKNDSLQVFTFLIIVSWIKTFLERFFRRSKIAAALILSKSHNMPGHEHAAMQPHAPIYTV
jgi:hypothetical protein